MDNDYAWKEAFEAWCADCSVLDVLLKTGCDKAWGCEEDWSDLFITRHRCDAGVKFKLSE